MNDENKGVGISIGGRVQGVGFRYFARRSASRYGVTGWVRNEPNGTVTVVAEGDGKSVDAFVESLRRGPSSAKITSFDVNEKKYEGAFSSFGVKY
jgi:acylphosphatase